MSDPDRTIELTATGTDERAAVAAGLAAILAAAVATPNRPDEAGGAGEAAVAIRGQGADLATVFFELANDLLAQLDVHGAGLRSVRLDGLLRTADGYTAWGYALGDPAGTTAPAIGVSLAGPPLVEQGSDGVVLRIRLRRD